MKRPPKSEEGTEQYLSLVDYWPIIHWDAVAFLVLGDEYHSRLYHGRVSPTIEQNMLLLLKGVVGGTIRLLRGFSRSFRRQTAANGQLLDRAYILLISMGKDKYASEERAFQEACRAYGVSVLTARVSSASVERGPLGLIYADSALTPLDYIWALLHWSREVARGLALLFSSDKKQRDLFIAVIPAIGEHMTYTAFVRRILADHGSPLAALSLAPWSTLSTAMIQHMKTENTLTAGIRTQALPEPLECLAINTEVLFCKSATEKRVYASLYRDQDGPRLEEACLLSLPEVFDIEPLLLPDSYVLILGTALDDQREEDYMRYNERLFMVAAAAELPVVFKGHNLSSELDDYWFAVRSDTSPDCLRVTDIRRNRELIDGATLVISAPSTLLYYAILRDKPIIVVEFKDSARTPEFRDAPVRTLASDQAIQPGPLDWSGLRESSLATKAWFEQNYYLDKGAPYMVEFLLRTARRSRRKMSHVRRQGLS